MVSLTETRPAKRQTADRLAATALSVAAHAAVLAFVLVSVKPTLPIPPPAEVPIPVEIMAPPPPPPPPPKPKVSRQRASAPPKTADKPAPGRPASAPIVAHKTPTPPAYVPTLAAGLVKGAPSQGAGSADGVSEGELSGAA